MKQISILGCGWLGLPLAKSLLEKGFSVKGSTTSLEKISVLKNSGIHSHLVILSAVEGLNNENEINSLLSNSEILIIDIPPKLRSVSSENFVQKIQNLIPFIEKSTVVKVIFVSSTAVYADLPLDCARSDKNWITEDTKPQPETESGKQLWEVEQLLNKNKNFQTIVVRFGGLIGDDRHPIHFLSGKQNLENPEAPINLIHQVDCIGIILGIICHTEPAEVWNASFNAVAPFHPSRKEYYTQKAIAMNLAFPEFEEGKNSVGKTIASDKVATVLKYKYKNTIL